MTSFALAVGDETVRSDDLTRLVGALIDGYPRTADPGDLLEDRWRCGVLHADAVQATLLADAVETGAIDLPTLSEEQVNVLLVSRASAVPVPAGRWELAVPLVLMATDYQPYTSTPIPAGNVMLVDPGTERTLLGSLSDLAVCTLYVNESDEGAGL